MASNPRQAIKAALDRSINHAEWIQETVIGQGEKYRADHPEILEQYQAVFAYFQGGKELLEGLRDTY